jgi:hypothetical protein
MPNPYCSNEELTELLPIVRQYFEFKEHDKTLRNEVLGHWFSKTLGQKTTQQAINWARSQKQKR